MTVKSLILSINARIQAVVDRSAFLIMRTFGVGKAYVRYTMFALLISSSFSTAFVGYLVGIERQIDWYLALVATLMLPLMHLIYRDDADAEKRSLSALSDMKGMLTGPLHKVLGLALLVLTLIIFVWNPIRPGSGLDPLRVRVSHVPWVLGGMAATVIAYLAKTPNRPPPRKERRTSPAEQPAES